MPAAERHPRPHIQLSAIARRARDLGTPFEQWWDHAVPPPKTDTAGNLRLDPFGDPIPSRRMPSVKPPPPSQLAARLRADAPDQDVILWPTDADERREAYIATVGAREGWRRAYEGLAPSGSEAALTHLAPLFDRLLGSGFPEGSRVRLAA